MPCHYSVHKRSVTKTPVPVPAGTRIRTALFHRGSGDGSLPKYAGNLDRGDYMKIDKDVISKVAALARLELTDGEKDEFSRQLSDIIGYVEKINELPTDNVLPADHIGGLTNVFREDRAGGSMDVGLIEEIAPQFEEGHFVVPKIIEGS